MQSIYESHITVDVDSIEFQLLCKKINVKPIIIEMDTGSNHKIQLMTRKFHYTDDWQVAKHEMDFIASHFSKVIRRKLEFIVGKHTTLPTHLYQEFHAKFELKFEDLNNFIKIVTNFDGHSSRNSLRSLSDDNIYHFATSRNLVHFKNMLKGLSQYRLISSIRECVIYDDNPGMDTAWSCQSCFMKNYEIDN